MDLLGSILNSMDKPPSTNEKEKEMIRKHKEHAIKMKNREIEELNHFRKYVEDRIDRFRKDTRKFITFQPMDKVYRTIVHEVSDVAGLVGMSFGVEGVDRYIIVYKKEFSPTEDEIWARRNGEDWDDEKAIEYANKRVQQKALDVLNSMKPEKIVPNSNYKDKYVHLIGQDAAKDAARKTESNKSYGFVPSANKKDIRSIEQTMADIQAKKRLKLSNDKELEITTNLK